MTELQQIVEDNKIIQAHRLKYEQYERAFYVDSIATASIRSALIRMNLSPRFGEIIIYRTAVAGALKVTREDGYYSLFNVHYNHERLLIRICPEVQKHYDLPNTFYVIILTNPL